MNFKVNFVFCRLHSVDTEEALADHYSQFSLYHGPDVGRMLEWEKVRKGDSDPTINTKFKYSSRTDRYQASHFITLIEILAFQFCLDNGIGEFANRFGLTARQFGENLDWKRHEVEQDPMTVDEVTEEYVSSTFPDRKNVLESGIFMVAKELSRQPLVGNLVSKNINGKISGKGKGTESIHPAGDNDCKADENRPKSVGRLSSLL